VLCQEFVLIWRAEFPRQCYASNMRAEVENAMELLRSHDPRQLERALELLQNTVFSFSMTVCGHRADAEDTAQEVLVKAIPHLGKFENAKALSAWLYTVAKNHCWMSRRKSKFAPRQHLSLEELMPDDVELAALSAGTRSPESSAMLAEDKGRLKEAILKVPPQYRLVLVLHDVEELSTEDIAKIIGIKEGNVRVRLHRARLAMRKELARASRTEERNLSAIQKTESAPKLPSQPHSAGRCKQVFSNLSNYLDGVLDDSLCAELERHMSGCKPCEAFLDSLQNTISALHQVPGERLESNVAAEARSRVLHKLETVSTRRT
jgi:RNA polymerase sigma-70 factor (ECF subfamily)